MNQRMWLAMVLLPAMGCASGEPARTLGPRAFYPESAPTAQAPQPIPAPIDSAQAPVAVAPVERAAPRDVEPIAPPATGPASRPSQVSGGPQPGHYLTLGGVVAEVNNTPIYAHQVLRTLDRALEAKARELRDLEQFRAAAREQIANQVRQLIGDELEFAAAQQYLDQREQDMARFLTEKWRQQKITEAGGSEQVARRLAAEAGEDFDDLLQQEFRRNMQTLYYQRRVYPHVQVTAEDMRRFYERNRDKLFTEHDRARFRVIKIDPKEMGGREAALTRIQELRQRVTGPSREDFAAVAGRVNHDRFLLQNQGDVGNGQMLSRGSYVVEKVEEAVWQLQPGEVTDVIEAGGAFYIARLEDREMGRVAPFEEQAVQEAIRRELEAQQVRALRERVIRQLEQAAIVTTDSQRLEAVVEMAVQRYPQWVEQG